MKENYIEFKPKKDHKWEVAEICNAIREDRFLKYSIEQMKKNTINQI